MKHIEEAETIAREFRSGKRDTPGHVLESASAISIPRRILENDPSRADRYLQLTGKVAKISSGFECKVWFDTGQGEIETNATFGTWKEVGVRFWEALYSGEIFSFVVRSAIVRKSIAWELVDCMSISEAKRWKPK